MRCQLNARAQTMGKPLAGINGFGRFGLGLFRAWFEDCDAAYSIAFINDDVLSIEAIFGVLKHDPVVTAFDGLEITHEDNTLRIYRRDRTFAEIKVTTGLLEGSHWLGLPPIIFDCSSRASNFTKYTTILLGDTRVILIGATTAAADATLIMGFNETDYNEQANKVISFGSCTVIPGVHVIHMVQSSAGVKNVLVNIVHSVPKWQLDAGNLKTIVRKRCTLENVAPALIKSVAPGSIKVNYTYAPYYGVSLMDFAFTLDRQISTSEFISSLTHHVSQRRLNEIIGLLDEDNGAAKHADSRRSISIIQSSIDVREDKVYFFGYFNNEGSGVRLHELSTFIVRSWH